MDKLKELLDGLVAEKSLSFDVLEQLRKVKTESDELIKTNLLQAKLLEERQLGLDKFAGTVVGLKSEITSWKNREDSLVEREKAVLDIEHKNEIEKMKATHSENTLMQIKEIVSMVFRNTNIRKSITGSGPYGGGANSCGSGYIDKKEEITEE